MSQTFTLTGESTELSVRFFPPIHLDPDREYRIGLVDLQTYNSIPNVDSSNNKFVYVDQLGVTRTETIPIGAYDIAGLEAALQDRMRDRITLTGNSATMKCELVSDFDVDFTVPGTIGSILGFSNVFLKKGNLHVSNVIADLMPVHIIRVECNLVTGSYINGEPSHTIHEFYPDVPAGYKLIQVPANVIYLPINTRTIDTLVVKLLDQHNRQINFLHEKVTLRLHLRTWD